MYKRRPIIKHNNILRERTSSFSRPIYIYERARTDETVAAVSPAHYIKRPWRRHSPRADACDIGDATGTHRSGRRLVFFGRAPSKTRFVFEIFFFSTVFPFRRPPAMPFYSFDIRVRLFFYAERVLRTRFPPIFCHRVKRFFRFRADSLARILLIVTPPPPPLETEALNCSLRVVRRSFRKIKH